MAFVPNYDNDIFISYAHVDDLPMPPAEEGWVTTLVKCIEGKLAEQLGRKDGKDIYSLWIDRELSRHVKITPQIMDALRKTATMIVILSPGYIISEWCDREKNAFLTFAKENSSRVFIVERNFVEPSKRPSEFVDVKGFLFWVRDGEKKLPRILGEPKLDRDVNEYYDMLALLIDELVTELTNLKQGQIIQEKKVQSHQSTIYLAQVTDDLEQERSRVKTYFRQAGINVLPNTWYSQDPNQFRQCAERDLAQCEVFVQLLSGVPGKKPPDLPQGYAKLQMELARTADKPIFQWRNPSLEVTSIDDKDHQELVDGDNVRAEGIEDFKRTIREFVLEKPKVRDQHPVSAMVFVNREVADQPVAEKICSYLTSHDIGWSMPLDSDDPAQFHEVFERNLLDCNGIIIIYGSSTVVWVHRQLLECRKILAKRDKPLQAFAVFEGPPEQKSAIPLKLPNLQVLNFRKGIDEELLEVQLKTFIEQLREVA